MIQVSFSGGRSSAMMAKIMIDNYPKDELIFTFANTGRELPETLDFVNECDIR
jgi:3'-phosphoadenosine 5'-phosphosulfate sulfotransferase (PAPS reductase)/FAD synthetase